MTREDLNTPNGSVDVSDTIDVTIDSPAKITEKDFERSNPELTLCTRLGILGLSLLMLWFAVLVISIVIFILYSMFGVPTPQTVRGEVINQASDYLDILRHGELHRVKILTWPTDGMYPTTPLVGFWPFSDYTVITTDSIKGKDIEVYWEDREDKYVRSTQSRTYVVGKYCGDRTLSGKKRSYFQCNEITTSLIYYLADGYTTWNSNIFIVLASLFAAVFVIAVAISCIVVPTWAVIGLCSMAFCSDNRICRELCVGMREASETGPSI